MTKEDKELLLKDLCARLPYVTFVYVEWHETEELEIYEGCEDGEDEPNIHTLISCDYYGECQLDDNLYETIYNIKPYLRPMSSMTDEEKIELCTISYAPDEMKTIEEKLYVIKTNAENATDFYNKHHFDYHGLIEKGLAIEVTPENNPYKNI